MSKLDDLKKQYPHLNVSIIDMLSKLEKTKVNAIESKMNEISGIELCMLGLAKQPVNIIKSED